MTWMDVAIQKADEADAQGEVPVGAVLVNDGAIIASSGNRVIHTKDACAHAELLILREGMQVLGTPYLETCDLYVTLEPCAMCAGAIAWARVRRLYFGAYDHKSGGVEHGARVFDHPTCHHKPEIIGGVQEARCKILLQDFFARRR
ncbi:MAG: nucleoside deaminase [Alphaproteobacteria bacterium]